MLDIALEISGAAPVVVQKASSGLMIAISLDEFTVSTIGCTEPDPHITLLYFGKKQDFTDDQIGSLRAILTQCCGAFAPLAGKIDGVARFPATESSDGKDVLVRLANIPRLEGFRENLYGAAQSCGIVPKSTHGFVPHVTMAYLEPGTDASLIASPVNITINAVTLYVGGETTDYPLIGSEIVKDCRKIRTTIVKIDAEQQIVFGWAMVIENDGEQYQDLHGDVISEIEMEKSAYNFVLHSRKGSEMHTRIDGAVKHVAQIVESIVFTLEKQKALGIDLGKIGWWIGMKVWDPEVWQKVKAGDYPAFSIGGYGLREETA